MTSEAPAVRQSIQILEHLAHSWPDGVSTSFLVAHIGMNRSTCYTILQTLRKAEWVTKLEGRMGWTLGTRMFEFATLGRNRKFASVQTELETLSQELGFVVFMVQRSPDLEYVVIAKAEQPFGVRITAEVGDRFPFSAPALMEAFEAWSSRLRVEELIAEHKLQRFTEYSLTSIGELHTILASVRERGYAYSLQRFDLSQAAAAAPIFDARGRPMRALCTLAFSTELSDQNVADVGVQLSESAKRITKVFKGRIRESTEN